MERENHINPELTGQAQNAYSNGMAENSGEHMGENPENFSSSETARAHPFRTDRPDANPEEQQRAREALLRVMGGEPTDPVTRAILEELTRIGADVPPINRGEDRSFRAQMNSDGDEARNGAPPEDNPPTGEDVPPSEDSQDDNGSSNTNQSSRHRSRREEELLNLTPEERLKALVMRGSEEDSLLDETLLSMTRKERDKFYDEIFISLDNSPEEFSDRAMSEFTDSYRAYNAFMKSMTRIKDNISSSGRLPLEDPRIEVFAQDYERYLKEFSTRKIMHDVSAIIHVNGITAEQFFGYVDKLESSLVDMVFTTPGMRQMTDLYEYAIRESMALNNGFLSPEKIRSTITSVTEENEDGSSDGRRVVVPAEIDVRTKQLFKELMEKGMLKSRTKDGKEYNMTGLQDWEINRLFNLARGNLIASGRMVSLAAESKLPPGPTRYSSGFLQDLIQQYSALKHLNSKFGITQEALAAYLYKGTTGNVEQDKVFKRWNPKELKDMWERYQENPDKTLDSLSNVFYLGRVNPNRAGDVWTWMSWRADNKSDAITMLQNFLIQGERKMADRWDVSHPDGPRASELIAFLKDPRFIVEELSDEDFFSMSKKERSVEMSRRKQRTLDRNETWRREHPGIPTLEEFEKYYKEYENWGGTGFRFEKLRPTLEKALDYTQHMSESDREKAFNDARGLLKRMSEIQGHRLYTVSMYVRNRITGENGSASQDIKDNIQMILGDMQLTEAMMLNDRENILNRGISFNEIQLSMPEHGIDYFERAISGDFTFKDGNGVEHTITRSERIRLAKEFTQLMKNDHINNDRRNGDLYFNEFVKKREYTHGFVLWSGDVPIDEYNAMSVGQTGAYARRGRDNKNQAEATGAETALLDNLKNIHDPEQLYEYFQKIFDPIDHYDRTKAQMAVAEKLMGILRFYKADSVTKIPFAGLAYKALAKNRVSFAQMMYGNEAMALESSEIRKVVKHFEHNKKVTHEQAEWILDKLGGTKKHVYYELSGDVSELGLMAILFEFLAMTGREIVAGAKEAT